MITATQPPWHMWGTTQTIVKPQDLPENTIPSNQISKVSYARPETWHFILSTKILSIDVPDPSTGVLTVAWDLLLGLGRSSISIPSFATHQIQWINGVPPDTINSLGDPLQLLSTQSTGLRSVFVDPLGNETRVEDPITQITAQEIQLSARVAFSLTAPGNSTARLELSGYLAPKSHVRPDWYLLDREIAEQFPGGEIGGK